MRVRSNVRAVWSAVSAVPITVVAMLACSGCGSDADDQRVAVHGTVTLDGKPLEAAAIVFRSGQGEDQVTAFGFVESGNYEIAAEEGPRVGRARVEFQRKPIEPAEFEAGLDEAASRRKRPKLDVVPIPPKYGPKSTFTAEVTLDGENCFDFDLESR